MELPGPSPFPGYVASQSVALSPDLVDVFRPGDDTLRWQLDFHYPHGIAPLAHELLAMLNAASQEAADALPVPTGRGLVSRLVGPHVYTAGLPVADLDEVGQRAASSSAEIAAYPDRFAAEWRARADSLSVAYASLMARLNDAEDMAGLGYLFQLANAHVAGAWRVHFELMYRLLGVLQSFRAVCSATGVPADEVSRLLAAGDTTVARTDRELYALSRSAIEAGLTPVFQDSSGADLLQQLSETAAAREWLQGFGAFLRERGSRSEAVCDVRSPGWLEAPERPLALIRQMLLGGGDPGAAQTAETERREAQLSQLRAGMSRRHRATFDRSYRWCLRANFAWWNEEHNPHIDLRTHLPIRAIGRAVSRAAGGTPDDGLMLYAGEVRALTAGDAHWRDLADVVAARREHDTWWRERRSSLPRGVGRQEGPADPLMVEIIGIDLAVRGENTPTLLRGLPASPGTVRGTIRKVTDVSELDRVRSGDILLCEATSPSWTPVFPRLAACLCDSGGALTHAAIICREYGLPCVCALGVATQVLRDGDFVEVDGRAGTVTVLRTA